MNGVGWGNAMRVALARHADAPNVDQVCKIVLEMFPQDWTGTLRPLLPLVAAFELGQTMRQVSFLREGRDPALTIRQIRAENSKTLYRRSHYPDTVIQDDLSRTGIALRHAAPQI